MSIDPRQVWNPYGQWSPYGGPISPFAQYFMGGNQVGNQFAPNIQQAQYAFSPFNAQSGGMDPLLALFSQLFSMGNALTGYGAGGQPGQTPAGTDAQATPQNPFPAGTPVYQPPIGATTGTGGPTSATATPVGTALTAGAGPSGQNIGGAGQPQAPAGNIPGTAAQAGYFGGDVFAGPGGPGGEGFGGIGGVGQGIGGAIGGGLGDLLGGAGMDRGGRFGEGWQF